MRGSLLGCSHGKHLHLVLFILLSDVNLLDAILTLEGEPELDPEPEEREKMGMLII